MIVKNIKGQAIVEYAMLVFLLAVLFMGIIDPFCAAFDKYLQGIYYILQAPYP